MLEQQRVHLGIDQVVDRHDLDVRRTLDQRLERLAADTAETVDADTDCRATARKVRRSERSGGMRPF
jgi:hypothetical protein